jgi:hypothetical protein
MRPMGRPALAPEQLKVPMGELLTPAFMSSHTRFRTAEVMLSSGGFAAQSDSDFAAIPREHLNAFIRSVSCFPNWDTMLRKARTDWMLRRIGLIFEA